MLWISYGGLGGGGAGSLDGLPGVCASEILVDSKLNPLNGGKASTDMGGKAGDSGGYLISRWPASDGSHYLGGSGSEFGAGGGGTVFYSNLISG